MLEIHTYYLVFDFVQKPELSTNEVWYQIRLIHQKYPVKIQTAKAE
jgi:hypothetical protein